MKTSKEVKEECIENLKLLIKSIEADVGYNYSFNMEVLEYNEDDLGVEKYVRYGIQRSEYFVKKE